jgi:hypothetical protein
VYQNNASGLEASLVSIARIEPHQTVTWVDDQVTGAGATSATATIGQAAAGSGPAPPKPTVSGTQVTNSPANGSEVSGTITNPSSTAEQNVVVYAVARRGGHVVSAGRAAITALAAHQSAPLQLFMIGNPTGASLHLDELVSG